MQYIRAKIEKINILFNKKTAFKTSNVRTLLVNKLKITMYPYILYIYQGHINI